MSNQQVTVSTTEGTDLSQALSNILAYGVTVDNLASSWLFLPDVSRHVPPWTVGWTAPLPGVKSAVLQWQPPGGIIVPVAGTGRAVLTYTDYILPFNPGVVVVQASPTGGATASQTHVIVDSGSITPVQPVQVTVSGQPIAVTTATAASQVATFANSVNPGATAVIVAASAGKVVTIQGGYMGFSISTVGAFAGTLETSTGVVLVRARADTIVTTGVGELYIPPVIYPLSDLGGVPLPAGVGLSVTNDGASASAVYFSGYLLYTQV